MNKCFIINEKYSSDTHKDLTAVTKAKNEFLKQTELTDEKMTKIIKTA